MKTRLFKKQIVVLKLFQSFCPVVQKHLLEMNKFMQKKVCQSMKPVWQLDMMIISCIICRNENCRDRNLNGNLLY